MSTAETRYPNHLEVWLPSQPERHQPCHHVETLARGKVLSFDCSTACFRGAVEAN